MTLNFVIPEFNIGGAGTPPLQFFRRGFNIGIDSGSPTPTWQDIILHGSTALTLVNAKANSLEYLKLYGECEQDGTPTPTQPIDIVCNNGAIKYSLNELNPSEIEIGYYRTSSTGALTESPYNFVTGYMPVEPNKSYVFFGRRIADNKLSSYNRIHWFNANKEYVGTNTYTKDNVSTGVAPANAYFAQCSCNESGATTVKTTQQIIDGYNWVFREGTSEVPYQPYVEGGLYTDGTVETVNVTGKNLFDKNHLPERITAYFANSGTTWSYTSGGYSLRFHCLPNTTYTARYNGNSSQAVLSFASTSNDDVPTAAQNTVTVTQAIRQNYPTINTPITLTTGASDKWLIVQYNAAEPQNSDMADNLQIELGSTATTYEPYYNGGTATAEMLLKVGDYQDIQSVLDGEVTRKIEVKVFNGTEDWKASNTYQGSCWLNLPTNSQQHICLCTHFDNVVNVSSYAQGKAFNEGYAINLWYGNDKTTVVAEFKAFLAQQYANGTPVILLRALTTATTETVTPQPLTIQAGTNIIEITQASIENLPLEVSYKAKTGGE